MKFIEKFELSNRGPVDPEPPESVTGTLLVGETWVASWTEASSRYGADRCDLYPAYLDGKRAWLLRKDWSPAMGYSASGMQETIIQFEQGVKLLIEHSQWDAFNQDR